jgi:hypothetical protein
LFCFNYLRNEVESFALATNNTRRTLREASNDDGWLVAAGVVPDSPELVEEAEVEHVAEAREEDDAGEAVVLDVSERHVALVVPLPARGGVGGGEVVLVGQVAVHEPRGAQQPRRGRRVRGGLHHHPQQRWSHQPQRVRRPRQRGGALAGRRGRRLRRRDDHQERARGRRVARQAAAPRVVRQQATVHGPGAARRQRPDHVAAAHPAPRRRRRGRPVGHGRRREAGEEAHHEAEGGMQQRLLPQLRPLLLAPGTGAGAAVIRGRPHHRSQQAQRRLPSSTTSSRRLASCRLICVATCRSWLCKLARLARRPQQQAAAKRWWGGKQSLVLVVV